MVWVVQFIAFHNALHEKNIGEFRKDLLYNRVSWLCKNTKHGAGRANLMRDIL
jgi:hypothetical protein